MPEWLPTIGAYYRDGATTFRIWAPDHAAIDLAVEGAAAPVDLRALAPEASGYWSGAFDDLPPGTRYRYRIDRRDDQVFPDPASRWQPDGVHGASQVVDANAFRWTDGGWNAGEVAAAAILVGGQQVVGTRQPDVPSPSGGTIIDAEARATLDALIATLMSHGLID